MDNHRTGNTMSRRNFITLAGGMAGIATLAAMGVPSGWAENKPKVNVKNITSNESWTDVLVIGGGMAGIFAAVKAHDAGADVRLISKGRLGHQARHLLRRVFLHMTLKLRELPSTNLSIVFPAPR